MKYYIDLTKMKNCVGFLFSHPENEAVFVGTTIHTEAPKLRERPLAKQYAEECDFRFFFHGDDLPELYTVPKTEIGGYDSQGGLFAGSYDFDFRKGPLYYIDRERKCYLITENCGEFLEMGMNWRENMVPTDAIEVFANREEAEQKYKIWDWEELLKEGDL